MRPRISTRGSVCQFVCLSVGPSGHQKNLDLSSHLSRAHLLVFPSLSNGRLGLMDVIKVKNDCVRQVTQFHSKTEFTTRNTFRL